MRVAIMILSKKLLSKIASETGKTELEVLQMLKKADAIGHTCIFSKSEDDEEWAYRLVKKSSPKAKLSKVA
jgi:hypothetical protein